MIKKLNLGCGPDIRKGWINTDQFKRKGVDAIFDLNKTPYPFKDNSIDEIYASHILEHLDIPVHKFMKEIHRILKPAGKITIKVPHFSGRSAFGEEHKKFFTILALSPNNTLETDILDKFNEVERHLSFDRDWYLPLNPLMEKLANKYPYAYEGSFLKALFPAFELKVVLRKK